MKVIGIDLAWQSEKNTTAIAIGQLSGNHLHISKTHAAVLGLENIIKTIQSETDVAGVAIDAPLIINNKTGQRTCEKSLSSAYGSKKATCHASNQNLYPDADSVRLSQYLLGQHFKHLGRPETEKWQIEIYPHPAIIETFGLEQRLLYKKGSAINKRQGQVNLAKLIRSLEHSKHLKLSLHSDMDEYLEPTKILSKAGKAMKQNEDALDAIMCAYIAANYALNKAGRVFGDRQNGYIYVPTTKAV